MKMIGLNYGEEVNNLISLIPHIGIMHALTDYYKKSAYGSFMIISR